jgi:hypothetical protein
MAMFIQFLSDESGATANEYGLIAAGILVAIITAVMASKATRPEPASASAGSIGDVAGCARLCRAVPTPLGPFTL